MYFGSWCLLPPYSFKVKIAERRSHTQAIAQLRQRQGAITSIRFLAQFLQPGGFMFHDFWQSFHVFLSVNTSEPLRFFSLFFSSLVHPTDPSISSSMGSMKPETIICMACSWLNPLLCK